MRAEFDLDRLLVDWQEAAFALYLAEDKIESARRQKWKQRASHLLKSTHSVRHRAAVVRPGRLPVEIKFPIILLPS